MRHSEVNATEPEVVVRPMDDNMHLIHVFVGKNNQGPVHEELPATKLTNGDFKLLKSPGLALNLAKNDIIRIKNNALPPDIISRGGNFCIQIYYDKEIDFGTLDHFSRLIETELGASLDGKYGGSLSFSVPATNGFERINNIFDQFSNETGQQWYYCNIYKNFNDAEDETLLDWWIPPTP